MTAAPPGPTPSKFSSNVLWVMASVGVAGLAGLALNYLIARVYDDAALGVFNQVFAVYILFSQLAALGIHLSVLRHVAGEPRAVTSSALLLTLILALAMAGLFTLAAGPATWLLDSPDVATGMAWAAPGLVFFALNKVVIASHNGLGRLRTLAVLQSCRFLFMLAGLALDLPRAALPVLLTIGEGATFLLGIATAWRELGPVSRRWMAEHLRFGSKAFPSGLFSELNTRVDVLVLGYVSEDTVVGVYSLAAILAEGAYQLLIALRTAYAPALVKGLPASAIRRGRNWTYAGALLAGALAIPVYALVIGPSWPLFAILIAGMIVGAGYVPFSQILVCAGLPAWHTLFILTVLVYNVAANAVLVPMFGPVGAACATASTFIVAALLTRKAIRFVLARAPAPATV